MLVMMVASSMVMVPAVVIMVVPVINGGGCVKMIIDGDGDGDRVCGRRELFRVSEMIYCLLQTKVDDWEFKGLFGVLLVDNVEEQSGM
ncbi:hypothetical protein Tco_1222861 [Tanacetum coccineum]